MLRLNKAFLVFRKDWMEIRRNREVLFPMVVVPILIAVMLPAILGLIPGFMNLPGSPLPGLENIAMKLPEAVRQELRGMTPQQAIFFLMSQHLLAPLFLVIPIIASSVVASDSFAGEKERRTIEALLATPITDGELMLGKILVSFIPSIFITIVSFVVHFATINILSVTTLNGRLLPPNIVWLMLVFGLAPMVALACIGLTVIISVRVKGFREAQQISVFLLIPILALVFGQISGAVILEPLTVLTLMGVFALIDIIVINAGVRVFGREEILSKLA